jgi:hypothetical protein
VPGGKREVDVSQPYKSVGLQKFVYIFSIYIYIYMMRVCLEHNETVYQLFIDFKKAYDSVRMEALYNILIEFGILKKLVRLIKMCLTETYSRVRVGKNLGCLLLGMV